MKVFIFILISWIAIFNVSNAFAASTLNGKQEQDSCPSGKYELDDCKTDKK